MPLRHAVHDTPCEILDDLGNTALRLRSLANLLHAYLGIGEASGKDHAGGIPLLIDANIDILNAILNSLSAELAARIRS
ncbi:hypothetical protein ACUSIJ_09450 [Pseudochelatococcus sp. B33]